MEVSSRPSHCRVRLIDLIGVEVRSERRLRLTFSTNLAAGAFGIPGPSYYVITSRAADTTAPSVVGAMIVSGQANAVELALSNDLVRGSLYDLTAVGVPAQDASTTPAGTASPFQYGARRDVTGVEPAVRNIERLLYRADLIWNGSDFAEGLDGDLARVEGRANVTKALWRSIETAGLPWDASWGVDTRDWVDSPSPAGSTLRGSRARQISKDPRVVSVTAELVQDGNQTFVSITPTLRTGVTIAPVSTLVDAS